MRQAWELFFLVASVMPPSKEFVSLVSEYVHTVAHPDGPSACEEVQRLAAKTWTALKRSAKAGPRRTVRVAGNVCAGQCHRTCAARWEGGPSVQIPLPHLDIR